MVEDDIEQLRQDVSVALDDDDSVEISKILSGISVAEGAFAGFVAVAATRFDLADD